jgi:hydrogenase nickel incorporation protein HypA/HybF
VHEIALCRGIRQVLEDAAGREGFVRVRRVRVEIGRFAAVEVAALRFGFDAVMRGSIAEGAELDILSLPGSAFCADCMTTVPLDDRLAPCPACGGERLTLDGGTEMRVKDLEVC